MNEETNLRQVAVELAIRCAGLNPPDNRDAEQVLLTAQNILDFLKGIESKK